MKKTHIILLLSLSFLIIFIFLDFEYFQKAYIKLFKVSTIIDHENRNGKSDGESVYYNEGKVSIIGNFTNGLKNGPMIRFYDNERVEDKMLYKNNKAEGKEYNYYETGKLKYECFWRNGKRYGDLYYYYNTGQLDAFHTYDILQQKINIIRWDQNGKIIKIEGSVLGENIFSINTKDSTIVLQNNGIYNDIDDLYITVSTPINFNLQFYVYVNNKDEPITIKDNTLRISNVFNRNGIYNISVGGKLLDKNNKIIEENYLNLQIRKQ